MSWRVVWMLLVCSLCTLFSAVAVLPASWLMALVPAHWPVTVVQATGALWAGSATVSVGSAGRQRSLPDPVRWQVSLWPRPQLSVQHPWLGGALIARPAGLGVQLSAQSLTLPATALAAAHDALRIVEPAGELRLSWPAMRIGINPIASGTTLLTAQWRNAASALSTIRPLGDYQLQVKQAAGGALDLNLRTQRGVLQLEGSGQFARGLQFDGSARAAPDAAAETQAALRELLSALGSVQDGRARLRLR